MALNYGVQNQAVLFGTKNVTTNVIATAYTLKDYYATADAKLLTTEGMSKIELHCVYTAGVGETTNSLQILIESTPDEVNYYQIVNEAASGGTSTETQREFTIAQSTKAGTLAYDAQTVNFVAGLKVTGGTSSATGYIESDSDSGTTGTLTLSNITGTFQDNETITDSGTGSATVNGILRSVTKFSLPLDISVHAVRINVKETGVATNAGTLFMEATISGR